MGVFASFMVFLVGGVVSSIKTVWVDVDAAVVEADILLVDLFLADDNGAVPGSV